MVVGRQSVELHLVISGCDQPGAGLRQLVNPVSNVCGILHCLETYVDLCCIVTSTQGCDHSDIHLCAEMHVSANPSLSAGSSSQR